MFGFFRLLYISYIDNQQKGDSTDQKERKLNSQILEGLNLVIEMACKNGQNAVLQCLSSLGDLVLFFYLLINKIEITLDYEY